MSTYVVVATPDAFVLTVATFSFCPDPLSGDSNTMSPSRSTQNSTARLVVQALSPLVTFADSDVEPLLVSSMVSPW